MLNFCSFPANSQHNTALLSFDFACSVSVLIQRFICVFFLFIRIFSPHCSENRFPPFLHQLQNLRLIGIILKRPVHLPPKTARTSHEIRTDFIRGHFSASFYFRSISNDTRRFPANFRSFLNKKDPKHVSVPWILIGSFGETLGCFGGEGLKITYPSAAC